MLNKSEANAKVTDAAYESADDDGENYADLARRAMVKKAEEDAAAVSNGEVDVATVKKVAEESKDKVEQQAAAAAANKNVVEDDRKVPMICGDGEGAKQRVQQALAKVEAKKVEFKNVAVTPPTTGGEDSGTSSGSRESGRRRSRERDSDRDRRDRRDRRRRAMSRSHSIPRVKKAWYQQSQRSNWY